MVHSDGIEANLWDVSLWHHKMPQTGPHHERQIPKAGKNSDRPLAHIKTLLLVAIRQLASLLERLRKRCLLPEMAAEAVTQALHFLGNTNAVRRGGIVLTEHLNRDLLILC